MLKKLFSNVRPARYDLLNSIVTFGQDKILRRRVASRLLQENPGLVLDLCCGTGKLTSALSNLLKQRPENSSGILGIDFCPPFLEYAKSTGDSSIKWIQGDAGDLPFRDESIDGIGITFSFRNLVYENPRKSRHLSEMLRVLRKGGTLVIAETSQPQHWLIRKLFHLYFALLVYPLGWLISGDREAYSYFATSAINFLDNNGVTGLLLQSGFTEASGEGFMFGGVAIYRARK